MSVRAPIPDPAAKAARLAGQQLERGVEAVASELRAAREGLPVGRHGVQNFRKWLGWASYRFAAWYQHDVEVNERLARELGFEKVSEAKKAVAQTMEGGDKWQGVVV